MIPAIMGLIQIGFRKKTLPSQNQNYKSASGSEDLNQNSPPIQAWERLSYEFLVLTFSKTDYMNILLNETLDERVLAP